MAIYLNGKLVAGGTVTNNKVTSVSEAVLVNQADLVQKANNVNIVIDENTPSPTINFTSEDNSVAINVNNANTVQSAGTVGEYTGEIIYLKQGSSFNPSDWKTDKIYIQPSEAIIGLWIYWYDSNRSFWYRYILSNASQIEKLEQGQNQYYDNNDNAWKEITE